jgi:hypothetical protein
MPLLEAIGFMVLGAVIALGLLGGVIWLILQPDEKNLYGRA